jgi:hypothetical protein
MFTLHRVATIGISIVLVSPFWGGYLRQQEKETHGSQPSIQGVTDRTARQNPPSFKRVESGEFLDSDGTRLPYSIFVASDGLRIVSITSVFDSPELATEKFRRELSKALKLIEQDTKKDKLGKQVGDRAQILMKTVGPDLSTPAVIWTFGSTYHEIRGASLSDILALESKYNH